MQSHVFYKREMEGDLRQNVEDTYPQRKWCEDGPERDAATS